MYLHKYSTYIFRA